AEAAELADGGGERGRGEPAEWAEDDRRLDAEQFLCTPTAHCSLLLIVVVLSLDGLRAAPARLRARVGERTAVGADAIQPAGCFAAHAASPARRPRSTTASLCSVSRAP